MMSKAHYETCYQKRLVGHVHLTSINTFMTCICDSSYTALIHPRSEEAKTSNLKEIDVIGNLQSLQRKYYECVPKYQGLVLRPKATSSAERALQLKRQYQWLSQQISQYKALPTKQGGRPRLGVKSYQQAPGREYIPVYASSCAHAWYEQYWEATTESPSKSVFCTTKSCVWEHLIGTKAVVYTTTEMCSAGFQV